MLKTDTFQITSEILNLIARIDEFKGAWRSLGTLAPDRLSVMPEIPVKIMIPFVRTLGLDRDSSLVAEHFDERDPAVKKMLSMAISACRAQGKYVGI